MVFFFLAGSSRAYATKINDGLVRVITLTYTLNIVAQESAKANAEDGIAWLG